VGVCTISFVSSKVNSGHMADAARCAIAVPSNRIACLTASPHSQTHRPVTTVKLQDLQGLYLTSEKLHESGFLSGVD